MNGLFTAILFIVILCMLLQIFYVVHNKRMPKDTLKKFVIAYIFVIFTAIINWLAEMLNGAPMKYYLLHGLLKVIEHSMGPCLFVICANFVELRPSRKYVWTVFGINSFIQFESLFKGWAFYIDKENIYHHGPLSWTVYASSMVGFFYTIFIYRNLAKRYKNNKNNIFLYLIGVYEVLVVLVHVLFVHVNLDYIGTMLGMMLLYTYMDDFNTQTKEATIAIQLKIMEGLAEDYSCSFNVNMESHLFEIIKYNDDYLKLLGERFGKETKFETAILAYRDLQVYYADKDYFTQKASLDTILNELENKKTYAFEYRVFNDGCVKYYRLHAVKVTDDFNTSHLIVAFEDVDEQKNRLESLIQMSNTDQMTGLYNRRAYNEELEKIDQLSYKEKENITGIMIDLNGLKNINDSLGHEAGDELITQAAIIMTKVFDKTGKCFRLGGDEFVIIAKMSLEKAQETVAVLKNEMAEFKGKFINNMTTSVGCVCVNECPEGTCFEEIIKIADQRMYADKQEYYKTHDRRR